MSTRLTHLILPAGLLIFSGAAFLVGITWGLPSRAIDPFLFGDQPVWTGVRIAQLAPPADDRVGADVDANPLATRDRPQVLNETDAQRAEIMRRYRLFSAQPDEMITFKSLARIKQFRGDPRLYQYGGLWIYPVGGLLKIASMVGAVELKSDAAFYLDHPEAFGRFYVVARLYVVAFGLLGAWAVFWLAKRWSEGNDVVAAVAVVCYAMLPVVVNMAHEAKPHLPGAVLVLLAIIAATKYTDTGLRRWWLLAGALCGCAAGMVLSCATCVVVLPVMALLRRPATLAERITVCVASVVIAIDVYFLTNPFVLLHLLGDRAFLLSNLGNSAAMYRTPASLAGVANGAKLLATGATPLLAVVGLISVCVFAFFRRWRVGSGWMLASACAIVLIQFMTLATGKPAEYARFALLVDLGLMLAAVIGIGRLARSTTPRVLLLAALCLGTSFHGVSYIWHFALDASARPTRLIAAERLKAMLDRGQHTLRIRAEPAPYCLPPVGLFKWKIVLEARDSNVSSMPDSSLAGVHVRPVDEIPRKPRPNAPSYWFRPRLAPTPMSWAAKPFEVSVPNADAP